MALIDNVRAICERLAAHGWHDLLSLHGLDITAGNLRDELLRELPDIDRDVRGFEDFASEGSRAIEPGRPAHSLLYHALASPSVRVGERGEPLETFPTLAEIETVENFVFGIQPPSFPELAARFPEALMAVAVFACEYRPGLETVHRRHADLCFSRTGVARVGTADPLYDGQARGFLPFVDADAHGIRVLPAQYAPYIAVQLKGDERLFGPMDADLLDRVPEDLLRWFSDQAGARDGDRNFWVPLHKIFEGPECVRGLDLSVTLEAHHVNEKIRRVHLQLRRLGHDTGWGEPDIDRAPFVLTERIAEFSRDREGRQGLLVPTAHERLVEAAEYQGKPLSFAVPPDDPDPRRRNPWAPSLLLRSEGRSRRGPEYVHARHEVEADGSITDLNELDNVAGRVRTGGYQALHYLDFTGDGWVEASCPELAVELPRVVPAYSMVTAPDFYPNCDQRELIEWWIQRVPQALRDSVWQVPPLTLSNGRIAPNLQLRPMGADFRPEDDTPTAIVSLPLGRDAAQRPLENTATVRHAHLPDAAASVFAPGWDTSLDETDGTVHLASYGLGSPFPEDAKLCAALSSFWPAVAPDVGRSFSSGDNDTELAPFPTATPLTDEEIGTVGALPWDGVPGPRPTAQDGGLIEYARFDHVDYVRSALDSRFSLELTGRVDNVEYTARILAMARVYKALGIDPGDRNWRVTSFRTVAASDKELREAEREAGVRLRGNRYRIAFGRTGEPRIHPNDHRRVLVDITETATAFAGAMPLILVKRADSPWRSVGRD